MLFLLNTALVTAGSLNFIGPCVFFIFTFTVVHIDGFIESLDEVFESFNSNSVVYQFP